MTMKLTPETVEGIGAQVTTEKPLTTRLQVWADNELKRTGSNPYLIELLREAAAEVARLQQVCDIRKRMIDIPTAWELTRATEKDQHHEKCSYRVASMLCDCAACRVMEMVSGILAAANARAEALRDEVARLTAVTEGIKAATEERVAALKQLNNDLQTRNGQLVTMREAAEQAVKDLRDEAAKFLAQVDAVEVATRGMFVMAHVHGMGYNGPTYDAKPLRDLLARLPAVTQTASQEKANG